MGGTYTKKRCVYKGIVTSYELNMEDAIVTVYVELCDLNGSIVKHSISISSNMEFPHFTEFCADMYLFKKDGTVNLDFLEGTWVQAIMQIKKSGTMQIERLCLDLDYYGVPSNDLGSIYVVQHLNQCSEKSSRTQVEIENAGMVFDLGLVRAEQDDGKKDEEHQNDESENKEEGHCYE